MKIQFSVIVIIVCFLHPSVCFPQQPEKEMTYPDTISPSGDLIRPLQSKDLINIELQEKMETDLIKQLRLLGTMEDSVFINEAFKPLAEILNREGNNIHELLEGINSDDKEVSNGAKFYMLNAENYALTHPFEDYLQNFNDTVFPFVMQFLARHNVKSFPSLSSDSAYKSIERMLTSSFDFYYLITAINNHFCSSIMFEVYRNLEERLTKDIAELFTRKMEAVIISTAVGGAIGYSASSLFNTNLMAEAMNGVAEAIAEMDAMSNNYKNMYGSARLQMMNEKINKNLYSEYYTALRREYKEADGIMQGNYFPGMLSVLIGLEFMSDSLSYNSLYREITHIKNVSKMVDSYYEFKKDIYISSLLKAYAGYGRKAIPDIFRGLGKHEYLNQSSLYALKFIEDKQAIPLLVDELKSSDILHVTCSLETLSSMHATEAIPDIKELLNHKTKKVRKKAEMTLSILEN